MKVMNVDNKANAMLVYMTYENGLVTVEIDDGDGKKPYNKSFTNATEMNPHDFCAKTADQIEQETGKDVKWSMKVVGKQTDKSHSEKLKQLTREKPLVVAGVVTLLTTVIYVAAQMIVTTTYSSSDASSSSYRSYASSSVIPTKVTSSNSYISDYEATPPKKPFEFGDGEWDSNSMYDVFVGSVTNVSDETYRFIQVRGTFTDENGNAIDTDTTYACGDEGLRPGETTKFTLSVRKDSRIKRIKYSVYDYR
jgi:hypothetical protein